MPTRRADAGDFDAELTGAMVFGERSGDVDGRKHDATGHGLYCRASTSSPRPRQKRAPRQGSKPSAETPKAARFTRARRAGLPARAPNIGPSAQRF
jgi:hypothetical protein